jgi:hypothetical protein
VGEVSRSAAFPEVLEQLHRFGLLLESDARLPSVAGLVAGGPVRGSWWGHPMGQAIFLVADRLADHADVIATKLVSGKVTYVHRRLWPAVVAVGRSREPWQIRALPAAARSLLSRVTRQGELRTDRIARPRGSGAGSRTAREAARTLETRLLVYSESIHTESGAHARRLETWDHWARRTGFGGKGMAAEKAKDQLEHALAEINARFGAEGRLPWS